MREIKFRAWIDDNEMLSHEELIDIDQETHAVYTIITNEEDDDSVFMQYTGLKDKNGVEIYEGDILKTHNQNNVVKYEYSSFVLMGLHEDKFERTYAHLKHYLVDITIPDVEGSSYDGVTIKLEVIGNIYEHPHLLEVS